jgi:glucosamine--fructose-6-phosphate aminotransferase (isomerizing)
VCDGHAAPARHRRAPPGCLPRRRGRSAGSATGCAEGDRTGVALNGDLFLAEIHEQPDALERLIDASSSFADAGRALAERAPNVVRLVGHGSSDAAASFGVYAFGLLPAWTALRDSISLAVYYDAPIPLGDSAVVALSQSGQTPDVVEYTRRARERGALTFAITNDERSELAQVAETTLPLGAGPERSVAASKTYVSQLASIALLAAAAAGQMDAVARDIAAVAGLLRDALPALEDAAARTAAAFAYVGRMYVIGRGVELATAREIALKLTETCRVAAEPLTATDFVHGPIAAVDPLFPVWTIATGDASLQAVKEAAARVSQAGATLVASGDAADEIDNAAFTLAVPQAPQPLLSPLLSVVAGQLFAAALARAKGLDPDRPERLTKVTLAL